MQLWCLGGGINKLVRISNGHKMLPEMLGYSAKCCGSTGNGGSRFGIDLYLSGRKNLSLKFWCDYGVSDERDWTQNCLRKSAFFPSFTGTAVPEIPSRVRLYLAPPMVRLYWKNLSSMRLYWKNLSRMRLFQITFLFPSDAS